MTAGVSATFGRASALSGVVIIVASVAVMTSVGTPISFTVSTGSLSGTVSSASDGSDVDSVCMGLSEATALTIGESSDVMPFGSEGFPISDIIVTWSLSGFDDLGSDVLRDFLLFVALAK